MRLDQRGDEAPFLEPAHAGREDQREGNKGDVSHDHINRLGQKFHGSRAQVRPFHTHDAGIAAQTLMELLPAYVHGVDLGRAVLEQAIRKAARGGSRVQTDVAVHVQLKIFQCRQKLVGSTADIALNTDQRKDRINGVLVAGLVHLAQHARRFLKRDLPGHDQPFGHFPALRQPLPEHQLVGPFLALRHHLPLFRAMPQLAAAIAGLGLS